MSDFVESDGWRTRHPLGPVRFDATCQQCGHVVRDSLLRDGGPGLYVEAGGVKAFRMRKIIRVAGETYRGPMFMVCSKCVPREGHVE